MHKRILIQNATLVNERKSFKGSLVIEDEHIEEIITGDASPGMTADETVDATGCYLLPGLIDEHVHFRYPGMTHKADIGSESRAAAAGGVTTYFDMPNTLPPTTTPEAYDDKLAMARRESLVNYGFYFGATAENAATLASLSSHHVCGIKLFMGASTGGLLVDGMRALEAVFEHARLPIVAHCEDSRLIAANAAAARERYGDDPAVEYHAEIRSAEACYRSTALAVDLARRYGRRLHVAHISTARELDLFAPGDPLVTAEACLAHLLYCEDDYKRFGTRIKCNPAVKTKADRDALRAALTDGRLLTVATDHAPHLFSEKQGGCLRAASGMPLIQFFLPAMLDLVDAGTLSVERLVELACHNPARLFGVENRGFLREGYKADLVLVRPHSLWTLTPNRIESRCGWSPLEGHTFHWRVEQTYCNGFLIYNNGHLTDLNFRGEAVTFAH